MTTPFLNAEDMADLKRLDELFSDDQGWDLPTERMRRLAELGVIRHRSGGHYCITRFGAHCLDPEWGLPLRTIEQVNADQAAGVTRMPGTSTVAALVPESTTPAAVQAERAGAVDIPTNEDQAALYCLLGEQWLRSNAPHRLKHAPPAQPQGGDEA
jgi:hypothetical protein